MATEDLFWASGLRDGRDHGMAVQAKAGFSRETLEAVAEQGLSNWPTNT